MSLLDSNSAVAIYYTLDGTTPTSGSTLYTTPISVNATTTIKAIAVASGLTLSTVASGVYSILTPTPALSPTPRSYTAAQSVTLTDSNLAAAIYYTLDGSIPTVNSTPYMGAIAVNSTTTVRAIAVAPGLTVSGVVTGTYTIQAPTPTFSPLPGSFSSGQTVSLLDTNSAVAIYYTLDGTTPTSGSTLYTTPISVNATTTIKAIAVASGLTFEHGGERGVQYSDSDPGLSADAKELHGGAVGHADG